MTLIGFTNNTIIIFQTKAFVILLYGYKNKMLLIWEFQY
ncbi:hypothetical protein SAMN05421542_4274 [Chryseobacterium jejuense]|uniref:Uncharacterized protein n=1 Tax=Chryseobacterium jejuense TaxID=445960 RepID=A0A2X2VI08_CHRJE|nr:hypothetical protein SAMN05421542_4274 [Chryseobacterium jejuense]SQB26397.1 Uncharacterised protein [Chryseobacterium jejuense]